VGKRPSTIKETKKKKTGHRKQPGEKELAAPSEHEKDKMKKEKSRPEKL